MTTKGEDLEGDNCGYFKTPVFNIRNSRHSNRKNKCAVSNKHSLVTLHQILSRRLACRGGSSFILRGSCVPEKTGINQT